MGVFAGTITFRRYRVQGDLAAGYRDDYLERIAGRVHRDIDPESDEERSVGWVSIDDVLERDFDRDRVFAGDYLLLKLRVDSLKVPASALRIYVAQAERELAGKVGRERLSKNEKEAVRERVTRALRRRVLPGVKGYDVAWNLQRGLVRLWTHNRTVGEIFEELFLETFDLRLVPHSPYTALVAAGLEERELEAVLALSPEDLVGTTVRAAGLPVGA